MSSWMTATWKSWTRTVRTSWWTRIHDVMHPLCEEILSIKPKTMAGFAVLARTASLRLDDGLWDDCQDVGFRRRHRGRWGRVMKRPTACAAARWPEVEICDGLRRIGVLTCR